MPIVATQPHKRKLTKKDFILNKRPMPNGKTTYNFAGDVKKHGQTSYSQNFATYNDIYGAEDVDYDLIDGLYHSTILNRVIKKIASDAVPEMFKVQIIDLNGERMDELEQLVMIYLAHLKRKHINQLFNYTMRYGTGFLYIGNKQEDQLVNMFCLHPKDLKPEMDESTGEIKEWKYTTQDGEILIPDEDLLRFPYDPDIGEVYGMSFIGKLVQTLHLMLNTELNLAEIVDKYAIPILQWLVEVGDDEEVEDDELYEIFDSIQEQFTYQNDVITTSRITTDVVGFAQSQYDMESTLSQLKESFGLLTFPMAIIGGRSDNLSSIKVQVAQYTNDLQDIQMCFSDELIEQVIEVFLSQEGYEPGLDYASISVIFPVLTAESNADTSIWLFPAIRMGLISRDEARAQLKFRGKAMKIEDLEFIDPTATYLQEMALEQQAADPDEPSNKDGRGDPGSD
ncbi:MAG: hypothetical protein J6A15_00695 [Clostridia bacterium]|nr:hypothetical protein [Clostridia bacterium]